MMSVCVESPEPRRVRVLVVDDEPAVIEAYRRVLDQAPCTQSRAEIDELRARLFLSGTGGGSATPAAVRPREHRRFDAEYCSDAQAAVEAVREACAGGRPYAVVFLDMRMPPGPDGAWAAERIRALDSRIEIVICTAYSDVDPAELGRRIPPDDRLFYLQKPFHPHEVRQLALALGQKRESADRNGDDTEDFDRLTGLAGRARFFRNLRQSVQAARRNGETVALLCLDLDNFRRINEALGQTSGDTLIRRAGERLREILRRDDVVARMQLPSIGGEDIARTGGDQFAVLLHHVPGAAGAEAVAARLTRLLESETGLGPSPITVTASVGIALCPLHATDDEALFRQASIAMYAAKRRGRGEFACYDAQINAGAQARFNLEGGLQGALERGEFSLHYQPQFDLGTGRVAGMEALLRWTHAELGNVPPAQFVPVAEETGLILAIGEWVLRTACRQVKAWHDSGLPAGRVAVNVSPVQFSQRDFRHMVAGILRETGLDPRLLELEITESLMMKDEEWTKHLLLELRALGVSIAIDDFGVGYSNLKRLSEFSVSRFKIDRSLVQDVETLGRNTAIVTAMVSMARALGLDVVAEGVENFDQLLQLQGQQCNEVQGFLLSRPLAAADAEALLQRLSASTASSRTMRLRTLAG
jgi:diguanylate cyclase (GGDEF)-like protein